MPLTDAEHALLQRAATLSRDIVSPNAARWERERRIGHEGLSAAVEIGLTRLQVPLAFGGLAMSFSCKAQLADVLGAGDFGFTMSLINTQNIAAKLARDAPAEVAARYVPDLIAGRRLGCTALTEPGAGSDFRRDHHPGQTGRGRLAHRRRQGLDHQCRDADVVVLYAQTEPGSGGRGIAGFVVDGRRPGFIREPAFALGGQHTIGTGGFTLNGYIASDDELLHPPGQAFKAALGSINGARTYIAAMCCGMVGDALRVARPTASSARPSACRWPITRAGAGVWPKPPANWPPAA
jgi:alkylation response protein AidB-like acyl-CoA dehydrogenase